MNINTIMPKKQSPLKAAIQSKLKDKGLKQKDLAEKLGVSESNLSHTLNRGSLDRELMIKISKLLSVDMSFFNTNSQSKSPGGTNQVIEKDYEEQLDHLKELLKIKDALIASKDETISALRESLMKKK